MTDRAAMSHCDQRILHAPADACPACDQYPDWQALRVQWGIAFTGHPPMGGQLPCPADAARPAGSDSDHRAWPGNRNPREETAQARAGVEYIRQRYTDQATSWWPAAIEPPPPHQLRPRRWW